MSDWATLLSALIDAECKASATSAGGSASLTSEARSRLLRLCGRILSAKIDVGVDLRDNVYVHEVFVCCLVFIGLLYICIVSCYSVVSPRVHCNCTLYFHGGLCANVLNPFLCVSTTAHQNALDERTRTVDSGSLRHARRQVRENDR